MPAWRTPEVRPDACRPTASSFSPPTTPAPPRRRSSRATASATTPAPTTRTSARAGSVRASVPRAARAGARGVMPLRRGLARGRARGRAGDAERGEEPARGLVPERLTQRGPEEAEVTDAG